MTVNRRSEKVKAACLNAGAALNDVRFSTA